VTKVLYICRICGTVVAFEDITKPLPLGAMQAELDKHGVEIDVHTTGRRGLRRFFDREYEEDGVDVTPMDPEEVGIPEKSFDEVDDTVPLYIVGKEIGLWDWGF
jgi:hypothetical protein